MKRIAVFASGTGTNFEAIARAIEEGRLAAKIALVVVDQPQAAIIEKAQKRLDKCLKTYKMELVINSLKWLGIVLLMICTSGCGKKDNKRRK